MKLSNKVAIITGGARGIGFSCAERFCQEGANVIICDVDDKEGALAQERLGRCGSAKYIHCDVSQSLDVHNLVAATLDEFERIDILVNNAGIIAGADFLDLDEKDFDQVISVNLKGAFLVGQCVARHMVKQIKNGDEPGSIINMSSINAQVAIATQVPYCVSKGGIAQLTKVMSLSLAQYGIRVNAIGPGSIMTQILEAVANDDDARNRILSRTPLGRIGEPEEIASIAAFLASDDASYVTGQTIYADGGRLGLNYTVPVAE